MQEAIAILIMLASLAGGARWTTGYSLRTEHARAVASPHDLGNNPGPVPSNPPN